MFIYLQCCESKEKPRTVVENACSSQLAHRKHFVKEIDQGRWQNEEHVNRFCSELDTG